ncbi:MAG: isoprenylcysteine carboxylmethyltransferase family protein [Alphaproteobacteria bacterium]|nr:isoprenylcysteine carboxylmethyltransferase family protein [Alphaproteobacteria bacterium]
MIDWDGLRRGKFYDLAAGLPLILWFGLGVVKMRPNLVANARALLVEPDDLLLNLRFFALLASAAFNLLLIYLVVVRTEPVRRASGLLPRACGFAGTFLGVGILQLKPAALSLSWQAAAAALIFIGALGSAIVLARLGKSFSIMPEARKLVTDGPYAYARHPLYAVEFITLAGIAIQFAQPWATLLALGVVLLQIARTVFEERVLTAAYPEYESYRARVKRFGLL